MVRPESRRTETAGHTRASNSVRRRVAGHEKQRAGLRRAARPGLATYWFDPATPSTKSSFVAKSQPAPPSFEISSMRWRKRFDARSSLG